MTLAGDGERRGDRTADADELVLEENRPRAVDLRAVIEDLVRVCGALGAPSHDEDLVLAYATSVASSHLEDLGGPHLEDSDRQVASGPFSDQEGPLGGASGPLAPQEITNPPDLAVARVLKELAGLLVAGRHYGEGARLYRRAAIVLGAALGEDNPEVAQTLHDLALACEADGRGDEARSLWAEARALLDHGLESG